MADLGAALCANSIKLWLYPHPPLRYWSVHVDPMPIVFLSISLSLFPPLQSSLSPGTLFSRAELEALETEIKALD